MATSSSSSATSSSSSSSPWRRRPAWWRRRRQAGSAVAAAPLSLLPARHECGRSVVGSVASGDEFSGDERSDRLPSPLARRGGDPARVCSSGVDSVLRESVRHRFRAWVHGELPPCPAARNRGVAVEAGGDDGTESSSRSLLLLRPVVGMDREHMAPAPRPRVALRPLDLAPGASHATVAHRIPHAAADTKAHGLPHPVRTALKATTCLAASTAN
nr:unnamed protein product [Digitaria exilis]